MGLILMMEQGALLHHGLPMHGCSLPSEHEVSSQFSGHVRHSYTATGSNDRHRGALQQQPATPFAFSTPNYAPAPRFLSDHIIASSAERSTYHATSHFGDSGSGSISTSETRAAASVPYTNYPSNHYTSVPNMSGPVSLPQSLEPSLHPGTGVTSIQDSSVPPPPNLRSDNLPMSSLGERDPYATNAITPGPSNQISTNVSALGTHVDTPRSAMTDMSSPAFPSSASHMAPSSSYGSAQSDSHNFPWPNLEILVDMTCDGHAVTPEIHAKVEKGFFLSTVDHKWTCYRRNYFSVACHFELHPNINSGLLFLKRNNTQEQIQAMGIRLSAAVDGSGGKNIELIQHTPKRDNGPKSKIKVTKLSPAPTTGRSEHFSSSHGIYHVPVSNFHVASPHLGPYLPLQGLGESNEASPSHQTPHVSSQYRYSAATAHLQVHNPKKSHTFERVQFKQATANNGKRRASQQYFHLVVELFADVRKNSGEAPVWVKVAQRVSEKVVVRGRSPSHYQSEGQNGQAGRGNGGSGSGYRTVTATGYSNMNTGGFRNSVGAYSGDVGGAGGYRSHYGTATATDDSESSTGSFEEGVPDTDHSADATIPDAERDEMHEYEGYQYYPSTIYEDMMQQHTSMTKVESNAKYSSEPRQYAVKTEYANAVPGTQWQVGNCSRFQGVDSSKGYFPDFSAVYK